MAVELKVNHAALLARARRLAAARLLAAGEAYGAACRKAVSVDNQAGKRRSQPGEPPRRGSGRGEKSIVVEGDEPSAKVRVGVTREGMHLFWLEVGTRRSRPRPWLVPTLFRARGAIVAAFVGGSGVAGPDAVGTEGERQA